MDPYVPGSKKPSLWTYQNGRLVKKSPLSRRKKRQWEGQLPKRRKRKVGVINPVTGGTYGPRSGRSPK